jgi:hypothetical protein
VNGEAYVQSAFNVEKPNQHGDGNYLASRLALGDDHAKLFF